MNLPQFVGNHGCYEYELRHWTFFYICTLNCALNLWFEVSDVSTE